LLLFVLGALAPLAGSLLLVAGGAAALRGAGTWQGAGMALGGAFLLAQGCLGLALAFKSWPAPRGHRLGPEEAPELAAWLTNSGHAWQGPIPDTVQLDAHGWGVDLLGVPTLGQLGWNRYHWVLGIYPLLALSVRELEAVVGWELVWWSNQQSWLNLQVKRLVVYWQLLHSYLGEPRAGWRRVLRPWFLRSYARWMVGRLESFLIRECLWTDAVIADQHGTATYARALCRLAILRPLLDRRVYPELQARVQAGEPLPEHLYSYLSEALGSCPEAAEGLLQLALDGLVPEAPPLLKARLHHLGVEAQVPLPPAAPALRHLLDGTLLVATHQAALSARVQANLDLAALRQAQRDLRFQELEPLVARWFPHHPHAVEYLNLAVDRLPAEASWDLLTAFREANPRHPDGLLLMVQHTLRRGWLREAEAQVKDLLAFNPFLTHACHGMLAAYHRERGDWNNAGREWGLMRRAEVLQERARRERDSASLGDALEPHGCHGPQLQPMLSYLEGLGDLGEAFLVRKRVAIHPDHPVLLLVVQPLQVWWDPRGRKRGAIKARLERECPFPGRATGHVLVARPGLLWRHRGLLESLDALILKRSSD
jgi:hypothetical protein